MSSTAVILSLLSLVIIDNEEIKLIVLGLGNNAQGNRLDGCSKTTWFSSGITIVGGNGAGSRINQLAQPTDMFVDDQNAIYITDSLNHRIIKWDNDAREGRVVAGGNGKGNQTNQLNYPTAVYVDKEKNIYVADNGNNRIQKWLVNGKSGKTLIGQFGRGNRLDQIDDCWGLYVDEKQNMYVAERSNNRITKWTREAQSEETVFAEHPQFGHVIVQTDAPVGIYVHEITGDIYVRSNAANFMKQFASNGSFIRYVGEDLVKGYYKITTTANELSANFYVFFVDNERYRTLKMQIGNNNNIKFTVSSGNTSRYEQNQFNKSIKVQFDSRGNLLVLDVNNHRVQRFFAKKTICDVIRPIRRSSQYPIRVTQSTFRAGSYFKGRLENEKSSDKFSPSKENYSPISDTFFPDPSFGKMDQRLVDTSAQRPVSADVQHPIDIDTWNPVNTDLWHPVNTDLWHPVGTDIWRPVNTNVWRPMGTDIWPSENINVRRPSSHLSFDLPKSRFSGWKFRLPKG